MNEILATFTDGRKALYATRQSFKHNTEWERGQEVMVEEGLIYYPFVIGGTSGKYYIDHLPSGFTIRKYTWKTLKEMKHVIEQLRDVAGCEDEDILDNGLNTVANFAGVIRDNI